MIDHLFTKLAELVFIWVPALGAAFLVPRESLSRPVTSLSPWVLVLVVLVAGIYSPQIFEPGGLPWDYAYWLASLFTFVAFGMGLFRVIRWLRRRANG
jgi:hypothetical protein